MNQFRDIAGRVWTVEVNSLTLWRIKEQTGVDPFELAPAEAFVARLLRDPVFVSQCASALCVDQMTARGVTHDEFMASMGGDSIGNACNAILDSYVSFFPSATQRTVFARIIGEARRSLAEAWEGLEEGQDIHAESGNSSTDAPVSRDAPPAA